MTNETLSNLGFGPFFHSQLTTNDRFWARIVAEHRGSYEVRSETGDGVAQLMGGVQNALSEETLPAVGDWVCLDRLPAPGEIAFIERVLARRTAFVRAAAGRALRGQTVAANVDIVFVVCGLDADFNVRRIERYLAPIWASGALPAVILSKADLCGETNERIDTVHRNCPDVPIYPVRILTGEGVDAIRDRLVTGVTAAFVGSSGAGKSTLVNVLSGEERMAVGEVRERDGRGQHTTVHRQLVSIPGGGMIIDTPGMREMHLWNRDGIDRVFSDIESAALSCRFADCRHQDEPGCAVRAAVSSGDISAERLDHYQKLAREADADALRRDEQKRRASDRSFSKMVSRDAKRIRRWKEGR